jgi:hypothetical protein
LLCQKRVKLTPLKKNQKEKKKCLQRKLSIQMRNQGDSRP